MAGAAFHLHHAAEAFHAFAHALQAEMAFGQTGGLVGIETRAIVMGARSDGLVKANEEFAAWLLGERSMPFGANGEHVTIRLIDFDDPASMERKKREGYF